MPMLRATAVVAVLVLTGTHRATAQEQAPPVAGRPRSIKLPSMRRFVLPNGLKVTLVPYGSVPKVTVDLAVPASVAEEAANEVWLSQVTGALMNDGTTRRTAERVADEAAAMGGSIQVWNDEVFTWVSGAALAEHAPALIHLVADVTLHPRLAEAGLSRAKADKEQSMAVAQSRAYQIGWTAFRNQLYGDQTYGHEFPTEAMLVGYTSDNVKQFYARNFGAMRSHLYVVGRFDVASTESAIRRAFAGWARGTAAPTIHVDQLEGGRSVTLIDRPNAVQSSIVMGLRIPPPSDSDHAAFEVTDALLAGNWASRITSNIREQKGYAYSPGSLINSFRGESFWSEQADVATTVTGAALNEIIAEMNRLRAEAPSEKELASIKANLIGGFVRQFGTQAGVIGELSFVDIQGLRDDYLASKVRRILAVTPETVRRIARTYLDPDRMTIVVVGDKRTVDSQLAPFRAVVR